MSHLLDYQSPPIARRPPAALIAVSWIFIAFGILSAIEIVTSLFSGRLSINLGILCIFTGWGLIQRRPGWRSFALVVLWIEMIVIVLILALALMTYGQGGWRWTVNGRAVQNPPAWLPLIFFALGAALLALTVWQYRVLTRSDVRALFERQRRW